MVDVVITYVDSKDKTWVESYNKFVKTPLENVENRFRSYDCLDLQIKLIRKNMSFVDKIFIVVSSLSQVPDNIKSLDNVHIVTHSQIIPKRYLPCFNSCAIEMYLYNIKGLSEYFIYFNDDIFPINKCFEKDFFDNGKIVIGFNETEYDTELASPFEMNIINSTRLINKESTKFIKPDHTCFPAIKSHIIEVVSKNINEISKYLTRTRHRVNTNFYTFIDYEIFNDNYIKRSLETKYFTVLDKLKDIYSCIKETKTNFICVNDNDNYNFDEWKYLFRNILECALDKRKTVKFEETTEIILNNNPINVALCAIAKNENLYIREWVDWYKNLGISKIFIYDNNDIDGERFEDVINDYIEAGFVDIIDRRGIIKTTDTDKDGQTLQGLAFRECYYTHYIDYDWLCFFDIDEYLEIYNTYNNLFEFLNDFKDYDGIRVQWKMYGDNDKLFYKKDPVFKRFKKESNSSYDRHVKQILNCRSVFDEDLLFCAHGVLNKKFNFVNVQKNPVKNVYMDITAHENLPVYLNHFYCKSTEEFFKRKYNKPSAVTGINNKRNFNLDFLKKQYFEHNKFTKEKERFIDIFINSSNSVNVYMASLYKDGYVIDSIKSIIKQPQVKSLTLSANNYTDEQYNYLISEISSDKLIVYRTNNEKFSFEKLRFVNKDITTKYVAFCDDDLVYYDGYFTKMIYFCEILDAVVSYHGGIFKKPLPIEHYYPDRKSFSFNREVKENKNVDIIGNGVSLFKRDWITYEQWKTLYDNAPEVSMDDITISYTLRKNGCKLIVVKHSIGDVIERNNNKLTDTVYNIYKKNDSVQTDWVNKYFVNL